MAERKKEPNGDRALTLLHQFSGHIVDCGNMFGVHGMA